MLQRCALTYQRAGEIISGTRGQNGKGGIRVNGYRQFLRQSVRLLKVSGCSFAERTVAADHGDSSTMLLQRGLGTTGRIARAVGFIDIVFDSGLIQTRPDDRPRTSRTSGGVVDDDQRR